MAKVKILQGLPASGKSTWARQFVEKNTDWVIVSRDALRNMRGKYWLPKQEKMITDWERLMIKEALNYDKNVIVDATNLNPKFLDNLIYFLENDCYLKRDSIEVDKQFLGISVETCIKRDLQRTDSVGEEVIRNFYDKYLAPEPVVYNEDPSLPKAIIVDVDGTLAEMNRKTRSPYDWDKVGEDKPRQHIIDLVNKFSKTHWVIIFTGRDGSCLDLTKDWLDKYNVNYDDIFIRPEKNQEKDSIIKKRMFEKNIRGRYFVEFVLDDRDQVVDMWRKELGLNCLQVNYGNF